MSDTLDYGSMSIADAKFLLMMDSPFSSQEEADKFFADAVERFQDYDLYHFYLSACMRVGVAIRVPSTW